MVRQIATFYIDDQLLGVDILLVKEIHKLLNISLVPGSPEVIRGLVNLRGKIVTVLDLDVLLKRGGHARENQTRLLIMKTNSELQPFIHNDRIDDISVGDDLFAFLIDRMDEVIEVDDEQILPTPTNIDHVNEEIIQGVVKLEDRLVLMLHVDRVIELAINASEQI